MTRTMVALAALGLLAGCSASTRQPADAGDDGTAAAARKVGELGVDTGNFDRGVRPQDDFYRFVNGTWLDTVPIPEDKSNYGSFTELHDLSQKRLRAIIEEAAASSAPHGSDAQKVGDFYASFMDTAAIERLGLTPLRGELARIDAVGSRDALTAYFGHALRHGGGSPFNLWVNQDATESTRYAVYLNQGGLGLPDRSYYFRDDEKFVAQREAYVAHIARMLELAGLDDAPARAQAIMALETRLAGSHWERVRNRDRNAVYNKMTLAEVSALAPAIEWSAWLADLGIGGEDSVVVRQPDYFSAMSAAIDEVPLDTWRDYLRWHLLSRAAPYLGQAFVDEDFAFFGATLRGIEQNEPRWKRGVGVVEQSLGEVVGRIYVERHFRPEAKARMEQLVENLRSAFALAIDELEWMSPETQREAHAKLARFTPKIGYPDEWKDYSALEVEPDALLDNVMASQRVEFDRMLAKLGKPVDRGEWFMTPQTVNAYYNPSMNEIVFPAAILQPPFFNFDADDAVNYGAIVAVIGHEFSHGFDDQGRKSDGDGNLRDWWTEQDAVEFKKRASGLVEQYNAFSPLEGMHVNGELTLGENIGDLAGLTMAYRAYEMSLGGREAPVIDGFTGPQRFFLGWGQVWRRAYRDDELRRRLLTDPHSPSRYRVNGIVANMPQFHRAFGVAPGDPMYLPPERIVRIW